MIHAMIPEPIVVLIAHKITCDLINQGYPVPVLKKQFSKILSLSQTMIFPEP